MDLPDVPQGDPVDPDAPVLETLDEDPDEWVDEHPEATETEIADGNRLGREIDIEDDDDAGQL